MRNTPKQRLLVWTVCISALLLASCGSEQGDNESLASGATATEVRTADATTTQSATTLPEAEAPPAGFTDATGTKVNLTKPVERIVCISEPCVDVLVELGITPVAIMAKGIAPLPEFFGDRAGKIPVVSGSFFEPSLEDIAASSPDLVIGLSGVHDALRPSLKSIPLYIVDIKTPEDAVSFLKEVGRLTGKNEQAINMADAFATKLAAAETAVRANPDLTAAQVQTGAYGFNIETFDGSSASVAMLARLTKVPFAKADGTIKDGFASFSVEQLLEKDPDVIFAATIGQDGAQGDPSAEVMAADPVWNRLTAVKNKRVIDVSTEVWLYGRGTRSLSIVLDDITAALD